MTFLSSVWFILQVYSIQMIFYIVYIHVDTEAPDNTLVEDLLTENAKLAQELASLKRVLVVSCF